MADYRDHIKDFEKRHHIFSAIMIGTAIVLFWRGVWELADIYLLPNNPTVSALISIGVAFVILYVRNFSLKELF